MNEILEISEWKTPASAYLEAWKGPHNRPKWRITKKPYGPGYFKMYRVQGYTWYHLSEPIEITALEEFYDGEWHEWMIDDPFHYLAIKEYCQRLEGKVLTSGLGLGLVAHELAKNPKVTEIVVVERSPEVMLMLSRAFPRKVKILRGDFWAYVEGPGRNTKWTSMFVDLWVTKGKEEHDAVGKYEVVPARERLKAMFPDTTMVFFGFPDSSDIDIQVPYLRRVAT